MIQMKHLPRNSCNKGKSQLWQTKAVRTLEPRSHRIAAIFIKTNFLLFKHSRTNHMFCFFSLCQKSQPCSLNIKADAISLKKKNNKRNILYASSESHEFVKTWIKQFKFVLIMDRVTFQVMEKTSSSTLEQFESQNGLQLSEKCFSQNKWQHNTRI